MDYTAQSKETFNALRATVQSVLLMPHAYDWSVQGFGMLRTYLGDGGKTWRLNIWDSALAVPNVSIIHDHPWDSTSWIIAGAFKNIRFLESRSGWARGDFEWATIRTGEGGGPEGERGETWLTACQEEHYFPGMIYSQKAYEIHASYCDDGTVTLNKRTTVGDGPHARVFRAAGTEWVDAEPRQATVAEVESAVQKALEMF